MVRRVILTAVAVLSVIAAGGLAVAAESDGSDGRAPDFVLKSLSGSNLRLSEYTGEVVMLVFWAGWCGECRGQLESLNELYESYHSIGLEILAVSLDPHFEKAVDTANSLDLQFPILNDANGGVAETYGVEDLPVVLFIDREGTVRDAIEGFERTDEDDYRSRLRELLRE